MYLRDDGYYEVGVIKVRPASTVFNKHYNEREVYWSNEDFGVIAKCTKSKKRAEIYFEGITLGKKQ